MFSSLSNFHHSVQTDSSFFTNSSIDLFPSANPSDSDALTDNSLPHDPPESVPVVDPAPVPAPTPVNPLRRSTRVRETPHSLADFHCYLLWLLFMSLILIERQVLTLFGSTL